MEAPESLPELALKGIEEFNKGEFYECHEYLEEAWMQEPRRVRFLYQGILQVGVGFYHQQNGNWRGATGLLRNGTQRLKEFEPHTLGIDVAKLVRESERCLAELEGLGRERVPEFDRSLIPKVEFVQHPDDGDARPGSLRRAVDFVFLALFAAASRFLDLHYPATTGEGRGRSP